MQYYTGFNLKKEPFSNSPDPELFFGSKVHLDCLQQLELAVRLRRGLCVVTGEVGTGKSTISRHLVRELTQSEGLETHLLLDPLYDQPIEFLRTICGMITGTRPADDESEWRIKEAIKNHLFTAGTEQDKTVVLIVDEGQKITPECLEILRELLNYETGEYKLLQIVLLAQPEFEQTLDNTRNLADRAALRLKLGPMDYRDMRDMIEHRIRKCSEGYGPKPIFSRLAMRAIHTITRGYPRRVMHLCHQVLLTLIIQNKTRATATLVQACANRMGTTTRVLNERHLVMLTAIVLVAVSLGLGFHFYGHRLGTLTTGKPAVNASDTTGIPRPTSPASSDTGTPPAPTPRPATEPVLQSTPLPTPPLETPPPETLPVEYMPLPADNTAFPGDAAKPSPVILGKMRIPQGRNLSEVCRSVYREACGAHQADLLAANPGLGNLNLIPSHREMSIPGFRNPRPVPTGSFYLLRLHRAASLAEAMNFINRNQKYNITLYVFAYSVKGGAPDFPVVTGTAYRNVAEASTSAASLPPELVRDARILGDWPAGTLVHTDLKTYFNQ